MRILICDDDHLAVDQIRKYIRGFFEQIHARCPELACYQDGKALLDDKGDKDILFIDPVLHGIDGLDIAARLKEENKDILILIVTEQLSHLDDAMRLGVFRYLSKPLDRQRFFRNMQDAVDQYNTATVHIPIETKQGVHTLPASSIISVEALERKVYVHTIHRDLESVHNMQYWADILPGNCFFQTHRSFIVNLGYVTDFDHALIHMAGDQYHAYLTRRRYSAFKEAYLLYLETTRRS